MGWGFMAKAPDLSKYDQIAARKDIPVEPYKPRFEALVEELKGRSDIELETCELQESSLPAEELTNARNNLKVIDDHMAQFYSEFDSVEISWSVKGAANGVWGRIRILPLPQVFSSWQDDIWFDDDDENKTVKPFDYFVDEAGCGLKLPDAAPETSNFSCPIVFFTSSSLGSRKLNLTFGGYMELLLKARGFWYWQSAVAADQDAKESTTEPRNFRKHISQIFPDVKVSDFLQRHEELLAEDAAAEAKESAVLLGTKKALEGIKCRIYEEHGGVWVEIDGSDKDNVTKAKAIIKAEFDDDISDLEPGSLQMMGGRFYKLKD